MGIILRGCIREHPIALYSHILGKDNCPASLGWPSWVDCCVNSTSTPTSAPTPAPTPSPSQPGDHNYCSSQNKCGENEGDCDNDNECNSGKIYLHLSIILFI